MFALALSLVFAFALRIAWIFLVFFWLGFRLDWFILIQGCTDICGHFRKRLFVKNILLILLSVFPLGEGAQYVAYAVGGVAIYGGSNCLSWGLHSSFGKGLGCVALYVASALGLDMAFRGLYEIMAGAGSA